MFQTKNINEIYSPTIVFDIDSVIAKPFYNYKKPITKEKNFYNKEYDIHHLDILGYTHQIYPGTFALLKALHDKNIRIVFFSSGAKERNENLVRELFKIAFADKADDFLTKVDIYSSEHCVYASKYRNELYSELKIYNVNKDDISCSFFPKLPKDSFGNYKKDLRILCFEPKLSNGDNLINLEPNPPKILGNINVDRFLRNIILLEDDPSYISGNQEKNFLYVKGDRIDFTAETMFGTIKIKDLASNDLISNPVATDFYHLYLAYDIIDKAFDLYQRGDLCFRDAVHRIQMPFPKYEFEDPEFSYFNRKDIPKSYYESGLKKLKKYWPTLDFC